MLTFERISILLGATLLASCAASGQYVGPPELLDVDRAGTATIYVMRIDQFTGSANTLPVEWNGPTIAELGPGDCLRIAVPAGLHFVLAGRLGAGMPGELRKLEMGAGETAYLRIELNALDGESQLHFDRLDPSAGKAALSSGSYTILGNERHQPAEPTNGVTQ